MSKPQKVDDFLDMVRRSGLVERDRLNRVLRQLKEEAAGKPISDIEYVGHRLVEAGLLTGWQCENLAEGRYKRFFLNKYKLLDHLGSGGMSTVYVLMQRRVAIKVLPERRVENSTYLARFQREARAAAALDHRNIVRAYDVDNDGSAHYLVMEYVEGRDLLTMVKQDGPLDYPLAAEYIRQAAEGLAHAHEAGLIHRDVKPANLLVDRKGVVKLLDLGLARFTGEEYASLTVANDENVLGTADYLAPEQALDSHGVDARADIYSLGCSFYFILTGHPPFPEGTLPQRLMAHQRDMPTSVREERPDAPEDLVAICMRMMAKKPDDRPQSAAEVAELMANWLTAHGHAFGSGSGLGGSSGKLAVAVAAASEQSAGAVGAPKREAHPGGSGSGFTSPHREPGSASGLGEPQPRSSEASDAASGAGQKRAGGGGDSSLPAAAGGDSGSAVEIIPAEPGAEAADQKDQEQDPASVLDFLASQESPVLARLRSRHQMTAEQARAYHGHRDEIPLWVWIVVGAGTLLALVLLVVFLVTKL
jgi:tRNA A-37 threonylcarbamoyl transferase component Bud32